MTVPAVPDGEKGERPWDEVTQTIFYDPERESEGVYGNCLQAAVASMLKLPIEAVPHFVTFKWWSTAVEFWLRGRNLTMIQRTVTEIPNEPGGLLCMVGGLSPRGVDHVVIAYNGEIVWDPHPSRAGLTSITDATWFRAWEHPSLVKCWLCSDRGEVDFEEAKS